MATTPTTLTEVLALPPDAERVREKRPDVVERLDEAYAALYGAAQPLAPPVLHAVAAIVARRQGSATLALHHAALADPGLVGEALPEDPKLRALIEHVDLITVSPALVEREDQLALGPAGVTPDEIVLASQVVAYTSTAVRVDHAFRLIAGAAPRRAAPLERPTVAHGREHRAAERTFRGSRVPTTFSRRALDWEPWVPPLAPDELTPDQAAAVPGDPEASSDYHRLLARVPALLRARSALDRAVFLGRSGLPRGERELAATVTSRVNDCIYCASVHSRKAEFQTGRADDIDRLLAVPLERDADWLPSDVERLAEGQDPRWSALILFTARLSRLAPTAEARDVSRLVGEGLSLEEVADAALATAFFSWANRLMLSLGEAAVPIR